MRLIVTGASGFIGRNVLLRAPREWQIVARRTIRRPALEAFVDAHRLTHVRAVRCDLDRRGRRPCAGRRRGGRRTRRSIWPPTAIPAVSAERPRWDLESNTLAPVTFLEHCPVDHLVYLSSGAVYDGLVGRGLASNSGRPAAAVRDLEAGVGTLRPLLLRTATRAPASYINVRFFGAYGPYEAGAEDHDAMAARARGRPARVHAARQRREPDRLHVRRRRGRRVAGAGAGAQAPARPSISRRARRSASTTSCRRWRASSASTSRCAHHGQPRNTSSSIRSTARCAIGSASRRRSPFDDGPAAAGGFLEQEARCDPPP